MAEPLGAIGPKSGRDASGRFAAGNRASLIVGSRSQAFWAAHEEARREIVAAVLADAGSDAASAPKALQLAAESIAQATLIRDAAFHRVVESGGPLTSKDRSRRAFHVWLSAHDRLEKGLRMVGLQRQPKPTKSIAELLAEEEPLLDGEPKEE